MTEKCPECGSEDFVVARNMIATRVCKCGERWEQYNRSSLWALRAEMAALKNPSDGRCMEIGALREHVKKLQQENDKLQSELNNLKTQKEHT